MLKRTCSRTRSNALILLLTSTLFSVLCGSMEGYAKSPKQLLIVNSQKGEPYASLTDSVLQHLALNGFEQGINLKISRWSIDNAEGLARRVWSIEKEKTYDAVYIGGTMATKYFKGFAFKNPRFKFVFGAVTDPVGLGVIDRFDSPPKANFTGVCYPVKVADRLRFLQQIQPAIKTVGYIYTAMPQSESYTRWIKAELLSEEFADFNFHYRKVQFVPGDGGHKRMTALAKQYVLELNSTVDAFLSPNDQMGAQRPFAEMVAESATKPLIGLGEKDVRENWGAAVSYFPSNAGTGKQIADMLIALFEGKDITTIPPQWPIAGFAQNTSQMKKYGLRLSSNNIDPHPQ